MTNPLIMVVEDNVTLLEGLKDLLEIANYRVVTAENGTDALNILEEVTPDLIISDIMMPRIDGYQFHAKVRQKPELLGVPFIFLSARGGKADIRRGKELGADDYITKPFDEEDLLVAVRSKLSRWQDLRRLQDEEIDDLKNKILLTMSHEFRTPLAYILNYTEMLEMDSGEISAEDINHFMKGIRKGAVRLNRLVEDFIRLVELETGEAERAYLRRRWEIPDISAWLRVITRTHEMDADEQGVKLVWEIPDGLPGVLADESYLADGLSRLIENAIKFSTPESETVRIEAEALDDKLHIRVIDQGVGIPEKDLDSLFNVFHQIDRAKHEQQGTGSGLAISHGIVELHGGEIIVDSEFGAGSTFTIVLPIHEGDGG
jgi:two-component system sensor kinase